MPRSITITGSLGSGKSTVAKMLAAKLGYTFHSTGQLQRQIANEYHVTTQELNKLAITNPEIDNRIDRTLQKLDEENTLSVVDARMGWFFMPRSFKVRLTASPKVAATRILNDLARTGERRYKTIDDALEATSMRHTDEVERFKMIYNVDIDSPLNYELNLDTSDLTPDKVCDIILAEYNRT